MTKEQFLQFPQLPQFGIPPLCCGQKMTIEMRFWESPLGTLFLPENKLGGDLCDFACYALYYCTECKERKGKALHTLEDIEQKYRTVSFSDLLWRKRLLQIGKTSIHILK